MSVAYNCLWNFAKLKPEERDFARTIEYERYLLSMVTNMIRYEGIESTDIPEYYPEYVAAYCGQYGVFPTDDGLAIVPGAYTGKFDRYGHGEEYHGTTFDGVAWRGKVGVDCFVVPNNPMLMPDTLIASRYAYMLSQADLSLYYNLKYSRLGKFYRADTDQEKEAIKKAINDLEAGEPVIYVGTQKHTFGDVFDNTEPPLTPMELTDVKDSEKLQYLSRLHDDIIGRFLAMYGIDTGNINKGSQVLRGELSRMEEAAAVPVYERLRCRQQIWDEINKAFGTNIKPVKSALYGDTPEAGTQQTDIVEPEGSDADGAQSEDGAQSTEETQDGSEGDTNE